MTFEDLIAEKVTQSFGSPILLGLGILLVFNIFVAVNRVPPLVAVLANGLLIILVFAPAVMNSVSIGGLGISPYIFFAVLFFGAVFLYLGLKNTVLRDY